MFTYCPNFGGCPYGDNQTFPYQGCQLKHQEGDVTGPGVTPAAYERGPPTPFASGKLPMRPGLGNKGMHNRRPAQNGLCSLLLHDMPAV